MHVSMSSGLQKLLDDKDVRRIVTELRPVLTQTPKHARLNIFPKCGRHRDVTIDTIERTDTNVEDQRDTPQARKNKKACVEKVPSPTGHRKLGMSKLECRRRKM